MWEFHIKPRLSVYKDILVRPWAKVVLAVYFVLALIQFIREEFLPSAYKDWTVLSFIPSWPWWGWVIVGLVILIVISLEGSYAFHRRNRATWRASFLDDNSEFRHFVNLWQVSKLLARGRHYVLPGCFPQAHELEEWHAKVRAVLREWNPDYDDLYVLNDKPNLGYRLRHLEETLDWILINTQLGKV